MENIKINFTESLLNLGRLHWYLLLAAKEMSEKRFVQFPPGKIHTVTPTEFGKEIENDEINWWVFKRERDIPSLQKKTAVTLDAAQKLKDATQKLSKALYHSIESLYQAYEEFSQKYEEEISTILEYTQWLHQKDVLAPTILYNYRTWGSTRMANRTVEVSVDSENNIQKVKELTLLVLGLIHHNIWTTFDKVKSEMEYDIYESLSDETLTDVEIKVNPEHLAIRVAHDATHDLAEFFEQLRDSLRNIMLDIEHRETQERLFSSDDFWRTFIVKAANSSKTEQKYWDFKKTLAMWHIKDEPLKSEKAQKFAELVAGFANNQGGVLIVGVTDDPPRQIVGLKGTSSDIENHMKYARNIISQHISYDKDFVHFQQVNIPDENGEHKLCLAIAIQQTVPGLGVKGIDGKSFTYPLREETGLVWKEQYTVGNHKIGTKSDNYDFLSVLQQFVNEEI
jgi:hypothetical protein